MRFRVAVGPGKTETMQIEEFYPEDSEYELSDLDDKQVAVITQQKPCIAGVTWMFSAECWRRRIK